MITVREKYKLVNDKNSQPLEIIKPSTEQNNNNNNSAVVPAAPSAATVTMVPLAKLQVIPNAKPAIKIPVTPISPPAAGNVNVYQQRKMMLAENRELFTALMKLRDKELQKKILQVINQHKTIKYKSIAVQTDPLEMIELERSDCKPLIYHEVIPKSTCSSPSSSNEATHKESTATHKESTNSSEAITKKRKRKRKVALPQANKESRVSKQTAKLNKPIPLTSRNIQSQNSLNFSKNPLKRPRMNSLDISENSLDFTNVLNDISESEQSKKQKHLNLIKDILLADIEMENGLLPIHDTIIKNQTISLERQIFICNYKKMDLNELVTDEGEDLLKLAVLHTCEPSIINILLENNLNPNCVDEESNTILHLAILNDVNVLSLEYLVRRIDLKLFTILNDDGYTPLHLAIRHDRYLLAERLINILDERLMGKMFYAREIDSLETDENIVKSQFKDYYVKVCLSMEVDDEDACVIINHDLKQQLLQCGDRRSGNTSLYFAIENKSEHLIYFLLAHLTDPRTENLSGQDCKSFFSEYGKSLNLSLNIDNTMEKIIKLLS